MSITTLEGVVTAGEWNSTEAVFMPGVAWTSSTPMPMQDMWHRGTAFDGYRDRFGRSTLGYATEDGGNIQLLQSTRTTGGFIPRVAPASGTAYVSRFTAASTSNHSSGTFYRHYTAAMLIDRLTHTRFEGNTTSVQTIGSPAALPARCMTSLSNATPASDGYGTCMAVTFDWQTAVSDITVSQHAITVTYVNSAGVPGRTATYTTPLPSGFNSAPTQWMYPLKLQAGDTGVRYIQTVTLSAAISVAAINMRILIYRPLAIVPITYNMAGVGGGRGDVITGGGAVVYDDSVLSVVLLPGACSGTLGNSSNWADIINISYAEAHG